jgi:hypothetical protein
MDTDTLLISIISAVIATALTSIIVIFFRRIIIPWYKSMKYEGYNVEGHWEIKSAEPTLRRNITFKLTQQASQVSGESSHRLKNRSMQGVLVKEYFLKGEIKDGYLALICKAKDPAILGFSTVLLRIVGDGSKMEGWIAAYNLN